MNTNAANSTETSHIRALQAHRSADFSLLYDAYSPALYGFLLRLVNDPVRAQHLLQEAFLTIWSSRQQYDPQQGRVFTWMLSITRTVALDIMGASQVSSTTLTTDQLTFAGTVTTATNPASQDKPTEPATTSTRLLTGLLQLKKRFSLNVDSLMAGSQA